MGEPDTLTRPILRAGTPEQVENSLMILSVDAAPVVGHLDDSEAEFCLSADSDVTGDAGS